MHGDVAGGYLVPTVGGHEDTDLGRKVTAGLVQVGHDMGGLEVRHATNLDLLADARVGFVQQLFDRLAVQIAGQQLVDA